MQAANPKPGTKPAHADSAKAAPARQGATPGANGAQARRACPPVIPHVEIENLAIALETALARYGQTAGFEEYLAGARVVEALRLCLGDACWRFTRDRTPDPAALASRLGKVATDIRTLFKWKTGKTFPRGGRFPDGTSRLDKAVSAIHGGLARQIDEWKAAGRELSPRTLALMVEGLRAAFVGVGSLQLLPHTGAFDERIATFTTAANRLWERTKHKDDPDGADLPIDVEAVITACARACGNKRELFGAERKRVKR
jgi:hypothetical protein